MKNESPVSHLAFCSFKMDRGERWQQVNGVNGFEQLTHRVHCQLNYKPSRPYQMSPRFYKSNKTSRTIIGKKGTANFPYSEVVIGFCVFLYHTLTTLNIP